MKETCTAVDKINHDCMCYSLVYGELKFLPTSAVVHYTAQLKVLICNVVVTVQVCSWSVYKLSTIRT